MRTFLLAVTLAAAACSSKDKPAAPRKVRVAAAADLQKAFTELGAAFQTKTGITVEQQFGASGLLAKQIEQGAPFSLFAAANRSFVDQVIKAGKCDAATARSYARGQLVVWTSSKIEAPKAFADLADPRFKKIAIANPATAPYGKAAKEALERSGLWAQIQDRIVLGENVQATLVYAQKDNADAAIVAHSLAIAAEGGASLDVDPTLYTPLDQALVICGAGDEADAARQYAEFVLGADGRALMTRYGFALPGDQVPSRTP
jgi:molybdate transport system substrate-binding protein